MSAGETMTATISLPAAGVIVRTEARWVSRENVEAAYGRVWSWLLDLLPALRAAGVPVAGSRKAPMVEAAGLDAFLRAQAAASALAAPAADALDEVDSLLARGGTKRARGASPLARRAR